MEILGYFHGNFMNSYEDNNILGIYNTKRPFYQTGNQFELFLALLKLLVNQLEQIFYGRCISEGD